jgi:hypothetical protein
MEVWSGDLYNARRHKGGQRKERLKMADLRSSIGDAVLEILEAVHASESPSEIEKYMSDERITRE